MIPPYRPLPSLLALLLLAPACNAADWHVSPSGNDRAAGTAAAPFRTVARALTAMSPGDRCVLRAGTYREELLVEKPNLTLAAAPGERVLLTGCDELAAAGTAATTTAGWTPLRVEATGVTVQTAPAPARVWQLFLDGAPAPLARFPNKTAGMLSLADWAEAEMAAESPRVTLQTPPAETSSPSPPADRPADFWRGGIYVGLHHRKLPLATWLTVGGRIATSRGDTCEIDPDEITFGFGQKNSQNLAEKRNGYGTGFGYIIDCLNALDAPGEWCWSDGTLHLLPPAASAGTGTATAASAAVADRAAAAAPRVEAQTRLFILRAGAAASGLVLQNLHFKAGAVEIAGAGARITGCTFRYMSAFQHVADPSGKSNWGVPALGAAGVNLTGAGAEVRDCYVGRTWWAGLTLAGGGALVENCVVEDCNWMGRRCGAIQAHGDDNIIRRCTIRRTGASAIEGGNSRWIEKYARRALWERNLCEDVGCLVVDQGFFYVNHQGGHHEQANSEWRYNRLHRYRGPDRGQWASTQVGLYTDNSSSGYKIHHNIVTGCREGIRYNDFHDDDQNGHDVWFCNNTFYQCATVFTRGVSGTPGHAHADVALVLRNNLGLDCGKFFRAVGVNAGADPDNAGTDASNGANNNNTTTTTNREFVPVTAIAGGTAAAAATATTAANIASAAAATGDFLPRAESGLVDAGVIVPGITDGFAGAAPDIGALEAGAPAWEAGATLAPPLFPDEPPVALPLAAPVAVDGGRASITATVRGNAEPVIVWQFSTDGAAWKPAAGNAAFAISADGKTLGIAATANMAGWKLRFQTNDGAGGWLTGDAVALTVLADTFGNPAGVCADAAGDLYVADAERHVIRRVAVGSAPAGSAPGSGAAFVAGGPPALPAGSTPAAAAASTVLAGKTGEAGMAGGIGGAARFSGPEALAVNGAVVYVADTGNHAVRAVASNANGSTGAFAALTSPAGIAIGADGALYAADSATNTIRRVTAAGAVETIAGASGGTPGAKDAAAGIEATFNQPTGLALAEDDAILYIADTGNHLLRQLRLDNPAHPVATLAGMSGVAGWRDGDVAERALFNQPRGLAVTGGVLYVADSGNHAVRAVDLSGPTVSTAAGDPAKTGAAELRDGDGGAARFWFPAGLAADALAEILYVADSGNGALRRLDLRAGNRVSTLAVDALNSAAAAAAGGGAGAGGGSSIGAGGGGSGGGAPTPVFFVLLVPLAILRAGRAFGPSAGLEACDTSGRLGVSQVSKPASGVDLFSGTGGSSVLRSVPSGSQKTATQNSDEQYSLTRIPYIS